MERISSLVKRNKKHKAIVPSQSIEFVCARAVSVMWGSLAALDAFNIPISAGPFSHLGREGEMSLNARRM